MNKKPEKKKEDIKKEEDKVVKTKINKRRFFLRFIIYYIKKLISLFFT